MPASPRNNWSAAISASEITAKSVPAATAASSRATISADDGAVLVLGRDRMPIMPHISTDYPVAQWALVSSLNGPTVGGYESIGELQRD